MVRSLPVCTVYSRWPKYDTTAIAPQHRAITSSKSHSFFPIGWAGPCCPMGLPVPAMVFTSLVGVETDPNVRTPCGEHLLAKRLGVLPFRTSEDADAILLGHEIPKVEE